MKLQKPKGTQDILPSESAKWQYVEAVARETFKKYNYSEIRTPMFEHYEVISRSVGDTTDIVTKEMYDFHDKGDRHITLRPEGTAPVVRSFVENKLFAPEVQKPVKMYYIGSMFRYERPQAVVYVNSTKSVLSALVQQIQLQTLKQSLWLTNCSKHWALKMSHFT